MADFKNSQSLKCNLLFIMSLDNDITNFGNDSSLKSHLIQGLDLAHEIQNTESNPNILFLPSLIEDFLDNIIHN